MRIEQVYENRKQYMDLLLIADESVEMIEKYMDLGDMFLIYEDELMGACIVIEIEAGVFELKNIALYSRFRGQGFGQKLVAYILNYYQNKGSVMYVGTGDSPLALPFYNKCGFVESHRVHNFFIDNYDHAIIEDGEQLIDMVYLKKALG